MSDFIVKPLNPYKVRRNGAVVGKHGIARVQGREIWIRPNSADDAERFRRALRGRHDGFYVVAAAELWSEAMFLIEPLPADPLEPEKERIKDLSAAKKIYKLHQGHAA